MAKGKLLTDTFEQIAEFSQSTVKKSFESVTKTFSPLNLIEFTKSVYSDELSEQVKNHEKTNSPYTPLDFNRLSESYQKQDSQKEDQIKKRLHQQFHQRLLSQEEKILAEKKAQIREKEKKEEQLKFERQKQQQRRIQEQSIIEPQGKKRRSIFSPKKVIQQNQAEYKPASGKQ